MHLFSRGYGIINKFFFNIFKLSFVFDEMNLFQTVKSLNVILLEEDQYLVPDALYVLKLLKQKYKFS